MCIYFNSLSKFPLTLKALNPDTKHHYQNKEQRKWCCVQREKEEGGKNKNIINNKTKPKTWWAKATILYQFPLLWKATWDNQLERRKCYSGSGFNPWFLVLLLLASSKEYISESPQQLLMCMYIVDLIYGEEEEERHWGGAIQMHIQRDRRQSTHALVWTLTYLHLNFNGSKFFRSHSWKLQRMEIWREDLKLRNFSPWVLSFMF